MTFVDTSRNILPTARLAGALYRSVVQHLSLLGLNLLLVSLCCKWSIPPGLLVPRAVCSVCTVWGVCVFSSPGNKTQSALGMDLINVCSVLLSHGLVPFFLHL